MAEATARIVAREPNVQTVRLDLCDLCLDGAGGECHVPECAMCRSTAPDIELRSKVKAPEPTGGEAPDAREWTLVRRFGPHSLGWTVQNSDTELPAGQFETVRVRELPAPAPAGGREARELDGDGPWMVEASVGYEARVGAESDAVHVAMRDTWNGGGSWHGVLFVPAQARSLAATLTRAADEVDSGRPKARERAEVLSETDTPRPEGGA